MSHKPGAYLGGIRSVEDLRQRCRIDHEGGCWLWGLSICQGAPRVYTFFEGKHVSLRGRNAALLLRTGKKLPKGHIAFATPDCPSDDCVNPDHCRSASRAKYGQYMRAAGLSKSLARTASALAASRIRAKLTLACAQAIRDSEESSRVLAERFGVTASCIRKVKTGKSQLGYYPQASVFTFR